MRSVALFTLIPAGNHSLEVGTDRMPGRDDVDVADQEGEHQEGADGMEQGDRAEIERHPGSFEFVVVKIGETGNSDQRIDQNCHAKIGEGLQRIMLVLAGDPKRLWFAPEDAPGVPDMRLTPERALEIVRRIQFHQITLHQRQSASGLSAITPEQKDPFETIDLPESSTKRL